MNNPRLLAPFAALALATLLSGCATLFSGTSDKVTFTSDPSKVKIYFDGRYMGTTPLTFEVPRVGFAVANLKTIKAEKAGYKKQEFTLQTEFNTVAVVNTTSTIPWLVDFVSGAVTRYSPTDYHLILEPQGGGKKDVVSRRIEIERYILLSYDNIVRDTALGDGEHLASLAQLLRIDADYQADFLAMVNESALDTQRSPVVFMSRLNARLEQHAALAASGFMDTRPSAETP
jgi:hypothetical protein